MRTDTRRIVSLALLAWALASVARAAPVPVTACGQRVNGVGYLAANLDCSATGNDPAVIIAQGRLNLNGFTVTGGMQAIECEGTCIVKGPGTVLATLHGVVRYEGRGSLRVADATVSTTDLNSQGVVSQGRVRITVTRSLITASAAVVAYNTSVRAVDSTLTGLGRLDSPSRYGDVAVGIGLAGTAATALRTTITGNAVYGVAAGSVRLGKSSVTGNGLDPICAIPAYCADLYAARRPRVSASTCGTSIKAGSTLNWGVCSLD